MACANVAVAAGEPGAAAGRRPRGGRSRRGRVLAGDLARQAAARMGCFIVDARRLLHIYADLIAESLAAGKEVRLIGLGTFKPLPHRRRQTVKFLAAKRLREAAARAPRLRAEPGGGGAV
ncbi:MAG: HU family DNA-binding protein, partial [Bacillota bacterium]